MRYSWTATQYFSTHMQLKIFIFSLRMSLLSFTSLKNLHITNLRNICKIFICTTLCLKYLWFYSTFFPNSTYYEKKSKTIYYMCFDRWISFSFQYSQMTTADLECSDLWVFPLYFPSYQNFLSYWWLYNLLRTIFCGEASLVPNLWKTRSVKCVWLKTIVSNFLSIVSKQRMGQRWSCN